MRIDIPDDKRLLHESRMPLRWGDMDALGHVNNTLYFRYMESARVEWIERVGGELRVGGDGLSVLIVNAFANFRRQLVYPAELIVRVYGGSPGRTSFDTWYTIERADEPGVVCADGGATAVWVDLATQSPMPLPKALRELLA